MIVLGFDIARFLVNLLWFRRVVKCQVSVRQLCFVVGCTCRLFCARIRTIRICISFRFSTTNRIVFLNRSWPFAQVFMYDSANWAPRDSGFSNVAVYHNPATNAYRVVAIDGQTNAVMFFWLCWCAVDFFCVYTSISAHALLRLQPSINSSIFASLNYTPASAVFHQWCVNLTLSQLVFFFFLCGLWLVVSFLRLVRTDQQNVAYGLNFASQTDADTFGGAMQRAVTALKSTDGGPEENFVLIIVCVACCIAATQNRRWWSWCLWRWRLWRSAQHRRWRLWRRRWRWRQSTSWWAL